MKRLSLILFVPLLFLAACTGDSPSGPDTDNFDRQAILTNWADNIIIPSLENLSAKTELLVQAGIQFRDNPDMQNLNALRSVWKDAYLSWQHVSMIEMGPAMQIDYRNYMNIYPVNTEELENNISSGTYNLSLPSQRDRQGFPALDYMLYGKAETDADILAAYTEGEHAAANRQYVEDLVNRIDELTATVLDAWKNGYRDEFIANSGNGANSSLDMMVNDYLFYYEKVLRAGKIGIPAGVFSGNPLPAHTEAYYSDDFSKELFLEALDATQDFFNGHAFADDSENGESLSSYLKYIQSVRGGEDLSASINAQFDAARTAGEQLNADLSAQVENENSLMLSTYDELQKNVVLMKVDMLQALNINVDYVDADGD